MGLLVAVGQKIIPQTQHKSRPDSRSRLSQQRRYAATLKLHSASSLLNLRPMDGRLVSLVFVLSKNQQHRCPHAKFSFQPCTRLAVKDSPCSTLGSAKPKGNHGSLARRRTYELLKGPEYLAGCNTTVWNVYFMNKSIHECLYGSRRKFRACPPFIRLFL